MQVLALGLSFSGSGPPVSVWISRLGHRELCFLWISLSVPLEASRVSGLVSKSATKRKHMWFLLWTRRHDRGRDARTDVKVMPGHGTAQAEGVGMKEEPGKESEQTSQDTGERP